jgi:RNA polymerase sigma-70 factor (ECF subfamily)
LDFSLANRSLRLATQLTAMSGPNRKSMEPDAARELEVEIELLKRVAQGDQRSFGELYDRFAMILFSTAYRMLKSQEAAEDVLQDVLIQIWKKAPLYDVTRGRPLTWALTLTRNKAIDVLRSTQRRSHLQENLQQILESFEHSDRRSFFDSVTSAETSKLIRQAIQKLSKQQRDAIELAFFSSMTHTEIAERLRLPLGTIKARIRRGMMALREIIEPQL